MSAPRTVPEPNRSFFELQARARRRTRWLLVSVLLVIVALVGVINLLVLASELNSEPRPESGEILWKMLLVTLGVVGPLLAAMLYKVAQLKGGGPSVAESLGGTLVTEDTRDPQLRRLRNIVEEMSIASGIPVPAIYVLEDEAGLNAFAAGYSPADAAVAVTRGCLDRLSRDELQAVIAHEFSHVLNGDMRLNIRLTAWVFSLLMISQVGLHILRSAGRSRGRNSVLGTLLFGAGVMVIGFVGVLFGHVIKAAVSRSREFLADASAVQFTRQNAGIVGALKKIAGMGDGGHLQAANAEDVSHMLFADGLRSRFFSTHPPILERIAALDPDFQPEEFAADVHAERFDGLPGAGFDEPGVVEFSAGSPPVASADAAVVDIHPENAPALPQQPDALLALAGTLRDDPLRHARVLRDSLPTVLREKARTPTGSRSVLLALLLNRDDDAIGRQMVAIANHLGALVVPEVMQLSAACKALHPLQRVPLAALALPALRRLPKDQQRKIRNLIPVLIHADGRINLHEYLIGAMFEAQLDDTLDPGVQPRRRSFIERAGAMERVLGVMARAGHPEGGAEAAYAAGQQLVLGVAGPLPNADDWHLRMDEDLNALQTLSEAERQRFIEALTATMLHNHQITSDEYELLRTCCAVLHCPLPPLDSADLPLLHVGTGAPGRARAA